MSKGRVLMAMSGGIDSSVASILLLEQGYELVGCTFRTFDTMRESCMKKEKGCCSIDSVMEAKHLAEQLGFEHHIVDFRQLFRQHVIANFVSEYKAGRTPNPCVICNSYIKWGELVRVADDHECAYIATGHYARIATQDGHYFLKRAADTHKDQTYFLWLLTEQNLSRTIFPLGDLTKDAVRSMAAAHGFEQLSRKPDSQEICFVPDNDYRRFLTDEGCPMREGDYIDSNGVILGRHAGYPNYTIGQRKGLGVALGYPAFVTRIDAQRNEVTLGKREDLSTHFVGLEKVVFRGDINQPVWAQIRYRSKPQEACLYLNTKEDSDYDSGRTPTAGAELHFTEPVWGSTPGQSCVMYQNNLLVGGGIIC